MRALRTAAITAIALGLASCSDEENARYFVQNAGYSSVRMYGSPWFSGCPQDDFYTDEFRAVGPNGRAVHGVVCTTFGFWPASHIRFYGS